MRRIICAAAVFLAITSAKADYAATGIGLQSCGKFAKQYQIPNIEDLYYQWAQGFLSGLNTKTTDGTRRDLSSIPVDQQMQFLRLHCNAHPLAIYMQGALDLYLKLELSKTRVKQQKGIQKDTQDDVISANAVLPSCKLVFADDKAIAAADASEGYSAAKCLGLVEGIAYGASAGAGVCGDPKVTIVQLTRVVVQYIDNLPARLHENFKALALEALRAGFPCKN